MGPPRAAQSKPTEPQDAFQVGEPHLDLLALAARLLEALGAGERPGDISGVLPAGSPTSFIEGAQFTPVVTTQFKNSKSVPN